MARDFGDVGNLESLDDDELRALIAERFRDQAKLDPTGVDVTVEGGRVRLSGRVGTENELEAYEKIVQDMVGEESLSNELVVDELTRLQQPEAADDAADNRSAADRTSDTADHLLEDTDGEQFGTESTREAIERGGAYEAPDDPGEERSRTRERH